MAREKTISELRAEVAAASTARGKRPRGRRAERHVPTAWQTNPDSLKTERVQFWLASGTMSGVITLREARRLVASGSAIVITDQAISQY